MTPKALLLFCSLILSTASIEGQIQYVEIPQTDLIPTHANDLAFSDVDGDGDLDMVIAGFETAGSYRSQLYLNNGTGQFTRVLNTDFPPVFEPSIVFVDIDGDNDEDLFVSGTDSGDVGYLQFSTNDGTGQFTTLPSNISLDVPDNGYDAAFADIDNDGDQDLCLIGGRFISVDHAQIYLNNGAGVFSADAMGNLQAVANGTVDFSDIDNDGDPDLLITGFTDNFTANTQLYENNGAGQFAPLNSSNLAQLGMTAVAFSDIDGDLDQDLIISGRPGNFPSSTPTTMIYQNNGAGVFTEMANNTLAAFHFSALTLGDVEGDGDEDLLIAGGPAWTTTEQTTLLLNDGMGAFTEWLDTDLAKIRQGRIALEDVSGDGELDIIFSGLSSAASPLSLVKVYESQSVLGLKTPAVPSIIKSFTYSEAGQLSIELDHYYQDIKIDIFTLLGRSILSTSFSNTSQLQLDLQPQNGLQLIYLEVDQKKKGVLKLINH